MNLGSSTPWQIEGINSMLEHRVFNAAGEYVGAFARKDDAELAIAAPALAVALLEAMAALVSACATHEETERIIAQARAALAAARIT